MKPKKLIIVAGITAVCLLTVNVVKNAAVGGIVKVGASQVMGAPVTIKSLSLSILGQSVRINGFRIYNPKGFPEGILVDIPVIRVDYDLPALLKKELRLRKIVINLQEMGVVKDKDGNLNVDALKVAKQKPDEKKKDSSEKMDMKIDELTLTIGKVIFKNYSEGKQPRIEVFDVGIKDKKHTNLTSPQQMAALVMVEAMKGTTIKGAAIYGAATLAGAAFLPVGVAAVLTSKDSVEEEFKVSYDTLYATALKTMKDMGEVNNENFSQGTIKGTVSGCAVSLAISKMAKNVNKIVISARKNLLPKQEIAGGVLYMISDVLR